MNGLIVWFANNKVAANLLMVGILLAGLFSIPHTRKEMLPNLALDAVNVTIPYPGASPAEVEKAICVRVESAVSDLDGIDSVNCLAGQSLAFLQLHVKSGFSGRRMEEEVKSRVEGIATFPLEVGRPLISEFKFRAGAAKLVISGPASEKTLKTLAEKVRDDLLQFPAISQAEVTDARFEEIVIEVSSQSLQRYDLSFNEVVAAVRGSSIDLSAGVIETEGGGVSVRTVGQAYTAEQFENIVLRAKSDGARIKIGDVAKVIDGFRSGARSRFNGNPAASVSVFRVGNESLIDISAALKDYIENPRIYLPEGIQLDLFADTSKHLESRFDLLVENALSGLVCVYLLLMLFLRGQLAFWVTVGIPVSILGTFAILPTVGASIDMVALFGFILVLGIVVDDAIIVGESVHSQQMKGITGVDGAIAGTIEVAKPVVFAALTTVVAFLPMLFIEGVAGKLIIGIPIVVIATLLFSLVESLFILPAHLADIHHAPNKSTGFIARAQRAFSSGIETFVANVYRPFLGMCLSYRYTVVSIFFAVLLVSQGLLGAGWIEFTPSTKIESEMAVAKVSFAKGSAPETTAVAIKQIEQAAAQLNGELEQRYGRPQIHNIISSIGSGGDENEGNVLMELRPSELRDLSSTELNDLWRKKTGVIADAVQVSFNAAEGFTGPEINIELAGADIEQVKQASDWLKKRMATITGLFDIQDSFERGEQEVLLRLKPVARDLGLNEQDLAQQVRQAFFGTEVQSIQRGQDEVKVMVRYPPKERTSLWYLENMRIRLPSGSSVPLINVADVEYGYSPNLIRRVDSRRVINVQAYIDNNVTGFQLVSNELTFRHKPTFENLYPDVQWNVAGNQKNVNNLRDVLKRSIIIATIGIYILIAVLFRSYWQPLMVLTAIPFGMSGALLGHWITGITLTEWSTFGILAASGVVVNDNLVLVDYINRKREAGVTMSEAIREAGSARFRPIVLTSVTTFIGLLPIMSETSWQAKFMVPMAVSMAFGVLFATVLSLVLVPALYHISEDMRLWFKGRIARAKASALRDGGSQEVISLDDAYQQGYAHGLSGKPNECPYAAEVTAAGWEAGWRDGYDEYQNTR